MDLDYAAFSTYPTGFESTSTEVFSEFSTAGIVTHTARPIGVLSYFLQSLVVCIGVSGTVANLLMFIILFSVRKIMSNNIAHILMINQSFLDLVSCACIAIDYFQKLATKAMPYTNDALGYFRCIICDSNWLFGMFIDASMAGLCVISFERYMKIVHNSFYKKIYRRWMLHCAVIFPWAVGIIECGIPLLITSRIVDGRCEPASVWVSKPVQLAYGIYCAFAYIIIPGVIFVYSYGAIAYVVWKHSRKNSAAASGTSTKRLNKSTLNVTKTLLIVCIIYMISIVPLVVFYVKDVMWNDVDRRSDAWTFTMFLLFVNSLINPLIYAWQYDVVKDSVRQMLTRFKLKMKTAKVGATASTMDS